MSAYNQVNPGKWSMVERQSEGVVVVRGRESRPHGEGEQVARRRSSEVRDMRNAGTESTSPWLLESRMLRK